MTLSAGDPTTPPGTNVNRRSLQAGVLPPGWEERVSKSKGGRVYFYNRKTGQNTWKRPSFDAENGG